MSLTRRRVLVSSLASGLALACSRRGPASAAPIAPTPSEAPATPPSPAVPAKPTLLVLGGTKFLGPHLVDLAVGGGTIDARRRAAREAGDGTGLPSRSSRDDEHA